MKKYQGYTVRFKDSKGKIREMNFTLKKDAKPYAKAKHKAGALIGFVNPKGVPLPI